MKGEKLPMKVNILSSFAAGILTATSICAIVYFSEDRNTSKPANKVNNEQVQLSEKEMKKVLTSKGYIVQTKDEYEKHLNEAKGTPQANGEQNQEEKTISKAVIVVSEGMTSIDVGKMLVNATLIQDAFQFSKDVESRGLQNKLRPGTYTVDSTMSYDQIITTIFQ